MDAQVWMTYKMTLLLVTPVQSHWTVLINFFLVLILTQAYIWIWCYLNVFWLRSVIAYEINWTPGRLMGGAIGEGRVRKKGREIRKVLSLVTLATAIEERNIFFYLNFTRTAVFRRSS